MQVERLRELALSLCVYVSLALSATLQFTFGPEAVLQPAGFYLAPDDKQDPDFRSWYQDVGALRMQPKANAALQSPQLWKFTSVWVDAGYYARQVTRPTDSGPPYKYRVLPTLIVAGLRALTGLSVESTFALFNALVTVLTACIFETYLRSHLAFGRLSAVLGGCLFVTGVSNTGTVAFPMLEPAASLCSCLIFMAVASGHALGFALAALAGVATKEVLIFAAPLWWLAAPKQALSPLARAALAGVPVLGLLALRFMLGGPLLQVNYGYDLMAGDFPAYWQRLFRLRSLLGVCAQVFLAFSFLWLGVFAALQHPFLRRCLPVVPLTIVAALLLSNRITRVLGVLFPVVVPGFMLLFQREPRESNR